MLKKTAIFTAILLVPAASALQTTQIDSYTVDNEIRSYEPTKKDNFQLQVNTKEEIHLFDKSGQLKEIYRYGSSSFGSETATINGTRYWMTGTKFPGRLLVFNKDEIKYEKSLPYALDGKYLTENGKIFSSGGRSNTIIFDLSGEKIGSYTLREGFENPVGNSDIDSDGRTEFFIGTQEGKFTARDYKKATWTVQGQNWIDGEVINSSAIAVFTSQKLSIRRKKSGELTWEIDSKIDNRRVISSNDQIVYSSDGELVFRNLEGGKIAGFETGFDSPYVFRLPERGWIGAYESGRIRFYDRDGLIGSVETGKLDKPPKVARYDDDGNMELAVASGNQVRILDLSKDLNLSGYSLDNTVFYGDTREVLKAVSMNASVVVSDEQEVAQEVGNRTLGIGSGARSVRDFDRIAESEKKFYADSRAKQIYVAAIASRENASLTFDREEADRDFSSYSLHEIQGLFIEKYRPHHVAVADLESRKGLLASYMAARQGVMPVDLPDRNNNGVILEGRLSSTFDRIGENRNTVFDGKHVSLLEGPSQELDDPVDGLIQDSKDGDSFRTDLGYGDLNDDGLMEAGVGRFPEDPGAASVLYHRSLKREIGDDALVASEYMHSNWPVILGSGGGGLRYGSRVETVLRDEGYETTHLVEQRADPVEFLVSLTPVELDSFLGEVEDTEDLLKKYVSDSTADMAGNAIIAVKALNYAEQIIEMYYEFRWNTYEVNIDRGLERMEELEVDLDDEGDTQRSVMKVLYAFVWPERHPEINQTGLEREMSDADIIYYQGVGNQKRWVMPNNSSGLIKDRYNGSRTFSKSDIPELQRSIVWDNSNLAGRSGSRMKQKFIDRGASAFIGHSSVNYPAYSSMLGHNFFLRRKTVGNSLKTSVNRLRTSGFVFSASVKQGIEPKMGRSLRLYGNPEMKKDPVRKNHFTVNRTCDGELCTLTAEIQTPQKVVEREGSRILVSNASNYAMQPGLPITPLYSAGFRVPEQAEIIEKEAVSESHKPENISLERYQPITAGGAAPNSSRSSSKDLMDPEKIAIDEERVRVAAAGYDIDDKKVIDSATFKLKYKTPASLELESENSTATAEVYTDRDRKARLIYSIDGNESVQDLELEEGMNRIKLQNLSYGSHRVEAHLVEEQLLASHTANITVARPLEKHLFAPDLHEADTRNIKMVVRNPNRFKVEKEVSISTGSNISLGMLEKGDRKIVLGAGESRELSWRVIGLEKGTSKVTSGRQELSIEVDDARSSESFLGTGRFLSRLESPNSEITRRAENDLVRVVWTTEVGELRYTRTPERTEAVLETDEFIARKVRSSSRRVIEVRGRNSFRTEIIERGRKTSKGNMSDEKFEERIRKMNREIEKMVKLAGQAEQYAEYHGQD